MSALRQNLLIELGTEELPPKSLKKLAEAFAGGFVASLSEAGLIDNADGYQVFATPRRLAVLVSDVLSQQADRSEQRRGPALKAAFDAEGNPSKAAEGFARSCGVAVGELSQLETDKGAWLVFDKQVKGQSISELAQAALDQSIKQLPIAKRMRWGDSEVEFVRPVHWLVALYGSDVLALSALELDAGCTTQGHRFHHPEVIALSHADGYASTLEKQAYVIADYAQRQAIVEQQATDLATAQGATVVIDPALLEEVTGLVEWPVALMGKFDETFLDVPAEALIASMKDHQKYFYLVDDAGNLLPKFITVSNIESKEPERVKQGNERVLRARLADGQFFWNTDRDTPLASRLEALSGLMFHVKLGSVADKSKRITWLSGQIAGLMGADTALSTRAATLCKADLVSDMVGEFPSLQGVMGRYYAGNDQEPAGVAQAIEQHYWPKFSGDQLPQSAEAQVVALADRLDSLVGIFATGEKPTGVKDPYALRRAALGILRILGEKRLDLSLKALLDLAIAAYAQTPDTQAKPDAETKTAVLAFTLDRLKSLYLGKGYSIHEFNAVAEVDPDTAHDFDDRIAAVTQFYQDSREAADSLAAANKRIANILKKSEASTEFDVALLRDEAEKCLNQSLDKLESKAQASFAADHYIEGLLTLSALKEPIDQFFDEVMVMADDEALRHNRLALLFRIRQLFLQVADLSFLNAE